VLAAERLGTIALRSGSQLAQEKTPVETGFTGVLFGLFLSRQKCDDAVKTQSQLAI